MNPLAIPDDAAAALVAAGSSRLAPLARAELDGRIARWGVCSAARNVGGIGCALPGPHSSHGSRCAPWRGRHVEVFPDYAAAAQQLVRLVRLATLEGVAGAPPAPPADTAGFRSMAPGPGEPPIEIAHTAGASEAFAVLAGHVGDDRARSMIAAWASASPGQRAAMRAAMDTEERAASRPRGAPCGADLLDSLAGTDPQSDIGSSKKKTKKKKITTAKKVIAAKAAAAAQAKAAAAHARTLAQLQAAQQQLQAQQQAAQQQAAQQQAAQQQAAQQAAPQEQQAAPGEPRTIDPPDEAAQILERLAALEQEIAQQQLQAQQAQQEADRLADAAQEMSGVFGHSDAAARAFQELAAGWEGLELVYYGTAGPDAGTAPPWKIAGMDGGRAAWLEFARAWRAGDNGSPQCNGDCTAGLNAQIITLAQLQAEMSARAPGWTKQLMAAPSQVGLDKLRPLAATVDSAAAAVPIVGALTRVGGPIASVVTTADAVARGTAPGWHYAALGVGALGVVGTVAALIFPRRRR